MLQWMDDFSSYGTNTSYMLNGLYAQTDHLSLVEDPDPNTSGIVLQVGAHGTSVGVLRKVLSGDRTTVGIAVRMWMAELPWSTAMTPNPAIFSDSNNGTQIYLSVSTTGVLQVLRGGTLIGATDGPALVANAWHHIETKVIFDNINGEVHIRVDGVPVLDLTNVDTVATGIPSCAQVKLGNDATPTSFSVATYFKDFMVWDGTGARNNDFVGMCSVIDLTEDADVSFNWQASTGTTGFNLINEAPPNDTDYIFALDPPPPASVFSLTNLPDDVSSVKGLMTLVRAWKTDGGDGNLQVGLVSNGTPGNGTDRPMTTAPTYWYDFHETDPDTGAPWTPAAVDAADISVNRTL